MSYAEYKQRRQEEHRAQALERAEKERAGWVYTHPTREEFDAEIARKRRKNSRDWDTFFNPCW